MMSGATPSPGQLHTPLSAHRCPPLPLGRAVHLLQTLETSLHLNKGLIWDLRPHWDPASSPQPCSKLLLAALHNLAFNESNPISLHSVLSGRCIHSMLS